MQPCGHNSRELKIGAPLIFGERGWVAWAKPYLRAKYHLDPSGRLATINMDRKFFGGPPPPF